MENIWAKDYHNMLNSAFNRDYFCPCLDRNQILLPYTFFSFFLPFDFCRFCVVIRFFIPATMANELRLQRIFFPRFYPLHLFSYLNSWERASIFPLECSVLNKGTTGTIFITSLVWRGPWLGIEPGSSCTQSQHSNTRLSKPDTEMKV